MEHSTYNPFPKNEIATNNLYQSTFLPKFQSAENQIKKLIVYYFLLGKSKSELRVRVLNIIEHLRQTIDAKLMNRDAYINGLSRKADLMISKYYDKAREQFIATIAVITAGLLASGKRVPRNITPIQLAKDKQLWKSANITKDLWAEAKASVRVSDYQKKIKQFINKVANEPITTSDDKKPISLWQKAELDIRHETQMENIDKLIAEGHNYCYLSSHPDCSKRCEKWQGKLVSLTEHATMSGFRVKKINGEWCYSLVDIMAQTDKYGYNNNIISGFNCRHYLIPMEAGKPKGYTEHEVAKERKINTKIREMEREIRNLQTKYETLKLLDTKQANELKGLIKKKTATLKEFCERYGFAFQKYRL